MADDFDRLKAQKDAIVAPHTTRLHELARAEAFNKHAHFALEKNTHGHVQGMNDREWGFSTCSHPDCVLVREALEGAAASSDPPPARPTPEKVAEVVEAHLVERQRMGKEASKAEIAWMRSWPELLRSGEPHPWYGPCDGMEDDGGCSECARLKPSFLQPHSLDYRAYLPGIEQCRAILAEETITDAKKAEAPLAASGELLAATNERINWRSLQRVFAALGPNITSVPEAEAAIAALSATRGAGPALHASAPRGQHCADCTMDGEACPLCYAAWWKQRHPHTSQLPDDDSPPCQFPIGLTTCGYGRSGCMHIGSTGPIPANGRHEYQPAHPSSNGSDRSA